MAAIPPGGEWPLQSLIAGMHRRVAYLGEITGEIRLHRVRSRHSQRARLGIMPGCCRQIQHHSDVIRAGWADRELSDSRLPASVSPRCENDPRQVRTEAEQLSRSQGPSASRRLSCR